MLALFLCASTNLGKGLKDFVVFAFSSKKVYLFVVLYKTGRHFKRMLKPEWMVSSKRQIILFLMLWLGIDTCYL